MPPMPIQGTTAGQPHLKLFLLGSLGDSFRPTLLVSLLPSGFFRSVQAVLVQREMDFCLIGVNRKWVTVTNLF